MNLNRSFTDLKRYKDIVYQTNYLFDNKNKALTEIGSRVLTEDATILLESFKESNIFRVKKEEKDVFLEYYNQDGFQ